MNNDTQLTQKLRNRNTKCKLKIIIGARNNHASKLLIIYKQLVMVFNVIRQGTYRKWGVAQAYYERLITQLVIVLAMKNLALAETFREICMVEGPYEGRVTE